MTPINAPTTPHPLATEARQELALYLKAFPEESLQLASLSNQLATDRDPFSRSNMTGHVTTAALIISADAQQVLLIHHRRFDQLLQPGGHHEGDEKLILSALREGKEETGVVDLSVHSWSKANAHPLDVDTHAIASNTKKGEGDHCHHDFAYLFVADPSKPLSPQFDEVKNAAWFPCSLLTKLGDARLERVHAKLIKIATMGL